LKYHRLKHGGVGVQNSAIVVLKLKDHRLKHGGVGVQLSGVVGLEIEGPAKARWCRCAELRHSSFEVEVPPAKARWCPNAIRKKASSLKTRPF